MRPRFFVSMAILALAALLVLAPTLGCNKDKKDNSSGSDHAGDQCNVPDEFCDLCGTRQMSDGARDVTLQYDNGKDAIWWGDALVEGDMEAVNFIPEGPFALTSASLHFASGSGQAIVHVMGDYGRSNPDVAKDLIDPITIDVPENAGWVTLDLTEYQLLFPPSQHFWIVYEHVTANPKLSMDNGQELDGVPSQPEHSKIKSAKLIEQMQQQDPMSHWSWEVGLDRSYLIRVDGKYFCEWTEEQKFFSEVTDQAGLGGGLTHMRVSWSDLNSDGFDDLVLTQPGYRPDSTNVYLNNGDGTFKDITEASGLSGHWQALNVMADLNGDGYPDVYAGVYVPQDGTDTGARSTVFLNNGDATFREVENSGVGLDGPTSAAAFGDYDADGNLDLYVGNWELVYPTGPMACDWLFKGNGDGTFQEVTDQAKMTEGAQGGCAPSYGVAWADFNNDGRLDILVSNYAGYDDFLWRNEGDGTFLNVARAVGVAEVPPPGGGIGFGLDWGDYNNDGNMDLYVANIAHPRYQPDTEPSVLFKNLGEENDYKFEEVREASGIPWDEGEIEAAWADIDNDGLLDLSLSDLYPLHFFRLFRQNEDHSFTDVTYEAGILITPATNHAWCDYDKDGRLDLAITDNSTANRVHLFHNDIANGNHWITFRLEGVESNRSAVGARVTVVSKDLSQIREVQGGKGHFNSQPSLSLHFGLGARKSIDGVQVKWPSGRVDEYYGLAVDKFYYIQEGAEKPEVID